MSDPPRQARYVLLGPTASGKSELARHLALARPELELVSVDAMAVYRGLDVGTAKPAVPERSAWHLIDLVEPDEEFSVAAFKALADAAIAAIEARAHRPLLVGGTGLYVRAVVDGLAFPARYPAIAAALEAEADAGGLADLYGRLSQLDPLAATRTTPTNRRRIVRALEVTLGSGRPFSTFGPGLTRYPETTDRLVGLRLGRDELDRRIEARLSAQFEAGFLEEVAALAERPGGLSRTAAQALGYKELLEHLGGGVSLEGAKARILRRTRAFARRQEAWFRRDPRIVWLEGSGAALTEAALALFEGRA